MLFGNVSNFVTDYPCQLRITGHIINQAFENVDEAAGTSQSVDLITVQNLKGILYFVTSAHSRQALPNIIDAFLQSVVLHHTVLSFEIIGGLASHFYLLFKANHSCVGRRSNSKNYAQRKNKRQKNSFHIASLLNLACLLHLASFFLAVAKLC